MVVGINQNPVVKRARELLGEAGLAHHSVGHGDYLTGYRRRLAIKMWSGYPTFPQVFIKGALVSGYTELEAGLKDGLVRARLAGPRPDGGA